jgi:hypothetical protein
MKLDDPHSITTILSWITVWPAWFNSWAVCTENLVADSMMELPKLAE